MRKKRKLKKTKTKRIKKMKLFHRNSQNNLYLNSSLKLKTHPMEVVQVTQTVIKLSTVALMNLMSPLTKNSFKER